MTYERAYPKNQVILLASGEGMFGRATYYKPLRLWDNATENLTDFKTHFSFIIDSQNRSAYGDGLTFFLAPQVSMIPVNATRGGSFGLANDDERLNSTSNPFFAVIEFATNKEACKNFTNVLWPKGNDRFCEIAHTFANMVAALQQLVMRMLFESYGIDEKHYESQRRSTTYLLRFLNYRKCHKTEKNTAALSGHTDKTLVSILHSDDVKGLELRTKDGERMHFQPSPSSYLVIAGDVGMAWSNDRIISCYHRVIVDPNIERYSLVLFAFLSGVIQTPKELVDDERPLKYKPFDHHGLLQFFQSSNVPNKTDSECIKASCGV
ncbi:2-oxoglutarate-dependent dioxygenase AOP3-like [Pistacia vera]|uniref:2-oxoglutarate-dependent dioxygenase AOP3-like n=1 Tax=Pistacia vera TaxID=55513 RepID=UPI0012636B6D|nr:2-oxoglutarate-dependent dioxygenase AOP3-like [Pistacia vera]